MYFKLEQIKANFIKNALNITMLVILLWSKAMKVFRDAGKNLSSSHSQIL